MLCLEVLCLEQLAERINAGDVTPSIDRTFSLDEASTAVGLVDAGEARGKLVIVI